MRSRAGRRSSLPTISTFAHLPRPSAARGMRCSSQQSRGERVRVSALLRARLRQLQARRPRRERNRAGESSAARASSRRSLSSRMSCAILAREMRPWLALAVAILCTAQAHAQIQVELKFKRVQYIAYEPIMASVEITNLAGRDIELHDNGDERWFGF